jgi:hypothetical protein
MQAPEYNHVMDSPQDILEMIDEAARCFALPGFVEEQWVVLDAHASVLRSEGAWTLAIEQLVYWPEEGGFEGQLALVGTRFPSGQPMLHRWRPIEPAGVEVDDALEPCGPASFRVGSETVAVDWEACAARAREHGTAAELEAFAAICSAHREALLLPSVALEELAGGLPRVLVVDSWQHPDLHAGELPSQLEGLRSLARVISACDPAAFRPDATPNNQDWRRWYGSRA